MQGIINLRNGSYIFRDDVYSEYKYYAWRIEHNNITDRVQCHKWNVLPDGGVILFDVDNPPRTIPYLPILD